MRGRTATRQLADLRLIHISSATLLALLTQTAALVIAWTKTSTGPETVVDRLLSLIIASLATILLFQVVNLSLLRLGRARFAANILLLLLVGALALYRSSSGQAFDYFVAADNVALLSFGESWTLLIARLSGIQSFALGVGYLTLFAGLSTTLGACWPEPKHFFGTLVATVGMLALLLFTPTSRHNDVLNLARSACDYHFQSAISDIDVDEQYPYVKRATGQSDENGPRPHVFIIMMESFNANFVETTTKDGREYTPFFNSLIAKGVYAPRYYGNGIQTAPGQLALLCSILPSVRGKVFTDRPNLRLRSLATILKEFGYNTLFFKGYKSLDFDNTGHFMRHIGFEEVHAMDSRFVTEEDQPFIWGWGLQDDRTYQKVFAFLDERSETHSQRPDFVVIHTVSHHMPFDHLPRDKRFLFPDAATPQEHFANSTYLADQFLREFFSQLDDRPRYQDSIVIVTGDHSFPAGEHGSFHNEAGFYEENFRTPFVLLWPEKLKAHRLDSACYSHLDVAPTILDLLRIDTDHHFRGQSFLGFVEPDRPIHLMQPYNGTYLIVVQFPWKYVRGLRKPGEWLFNLKEDTKERQNLVKEFRNDALLGRLKAEIEPIRLNQRLVDENRVWPGKSEQPTLR